MKKEIKNKIINSVKSTHARAMSKMHVIPNIDVAIISLEKSLMLDNYDNAEKALNKIVLSEQKYKDAGINIISNRLKELSVLGVDKDKSNIVKGKMNMLEKLWKVGIEKGLTSGDGNEKIMTDNIKIIALFVNDSELLKTWITHHTYNKKTLHAVAVTLMSYINYKNYLPIWDEFYNKHKPDFNPDFYYNNYKFISHLLHYAPEEHCLEEVAKTKEIDEDALKLFIIRKKDISSKILNALAEKTGGMENLLRKIFKAHDSMMIDNNEYIKDEKKHWVSGGVKKNMEKLVLENKTLGPIIKNKWIEVMTDKEKKELRENIKTNNNNKTLRKI